MYATIWHVDSVKILTRRELASVLDDLARRAPRSASTRMNRGIFRLACCCGLRVSEIAALGIGHVCLGGARPHLRVGPEGTKGRKAARRAALVGRGHARRPDGVEAGTGAARRPAE